MKNTIKINIKTLATYIVMLMSMVYAPSMLAQPCGPGVGTVIFSEDFEDEADAATSGTDATGTAWTATCTGCVAGDFFEVDSNSGNAMGCNGTQGLRGNDTNGPGVFSATVDLTGCEVVYFGFDYCASGYTGTGNLECADECSGCSGVPSEGVSNGGCNNCWDFLYGELDWGSGNAQQILLGDDCAVPPNGTTGNAICGTLDADGNPIPTADLTSVDINIVMAMWAGTENMVIDNIMVICYTAAEVAACSDASVTDACPCPDLTGIVAGDLDVGVTESTCPMGQMMPSGGSLAAPTTMCPAGSVLEYSLDNFATAGTMTLPTYDQANAITVSTRCVCGSDDTQISAVSTVTTVPGVCVSCPDFSTVTAGTIPATITESTCTTAGGTAGQDTPGSVAAPATACPMGSTLQYSTDNVTWVAAPPAYVDDTPIAVYTRCNCDSDMDVSSEVSTVITVPGLCPAPPEACNACDCDSANAPMDSYTINTIAGNGGQAGYTMIYSLTGNGDPLETAMPTGTTPASFPGLADNAAYEVCVFTVADADMAAFQAALSGEAAVADAVAGTGAFMGLCYESACMTFPAEDCQCTTCPDLAAAGSEAPPVNIDSEAGCDTSTTPFTATVGVTSDVTAACPVGSTLEYSFDMGATWVATFMDTYDQTTSVEIRTRCVCDSDNTIIGPETVVTTNPQEGCPAEVCPSCDCTATAGDYYTINTTAVGQAGYTTVYILVDNDNGDVVLQNNQTGMFTPVPDNVNYTVYAYNVLDAEVAAFEAAIPANISAVGDAIGTFCAAGASEPFFQDCDCCPDIAATLSGEGQICTSSDAVDLSISIDAGTAPYTVVYSDGTTNTTITGYNSNDAITLSPTSTTPGATVFTYTLVSVEDANGCTATVDGTGTITVLMSCADAGGFNRN